jgi:hypothetical protein
MSLELLNQKVKHYKGESYKVIYDKRLQGVGYYAFSKGESIFLGRSLKFAINLMDLLIKNNNNAKT